MRRALWGDTAEEASESCPKRHSGLKGNAHIGLKPEWKGLLENSNAKDKRAKKGRGEPKTCWENSTPRTAEKKRPSLALLPGKQLKVHAQTVPRSKKINASSLLWSPPALSLCLLANASLLRRTGCCTAPWHKLEQRQDDPSGHQGGKSNLWGLFPSTQTGGGIKGRQLLSFHSSRAPVLEQRAQ